MCTRRIAELIDSMFINGTINMIGSFIGHCIEHKRNLERPRKGNKEGFATDFFRVLECLLLI
jgi:hypothetical protein